MPSVSKPDITPSPLIDIADRLATNADSLILAWTEQIALSKNLRSREDLEEHGPPYPSFEACSMPWSPN